MPALNQIKSTPEVLAQHQSTSVILLGEIHTSVDHHRWQAQTVAQLHAGRPDMVLGFEAFPRRVQATLDQWVAGELSEAEFLRLSEWDTVWKYDPGLYLPLFHFARLNGVPMIALNVDHSLIAKVSKKGWKHVPEDERLGISTPARPSDAYVKTLGEVFALHGDASKTPGQFQNFMDAQFTWDRAMAERIAESIAQSPSQVVAIVGSGHVDYGYGIPHQLRDLGVHDVAVLTPWDSGSPCADLKDDNQTPVASAVFGLPPFHEPAAPSGPSLGVMIETTKGGVRVRQVITGSIAERTGVQKDDIIVTAAGQPIATIGALVTIIKAMTPGTWLPLHLKRGAIELDLIAKFPAP